MFFHARLRCHKSKTYLIKDLTFLIKELKILRVRKGLYSCVVRKDLKVYLELSLGAYCACNSRRSAFFDSSIADNS